MKLPPTRETVDGGRSLDHLLARLDVVAARVERAVARRRVNDPDPTDRFRGLYLADATVDALLSERRPPLFDEAADDLVLALEGRADEWEARARTCVCA